MCYSLTVLHSVCYLGREAVEIDERAGSVASSGDERIADPT